MTWTGINRGKNFLPAVTILLNVPIRRGRAPSSCRSSCYGSVSILPAADLCRLDARPALPEANDTHQDPHVPLTPAHAAAVVPFCRWKPYFWLSPLVVGSMAPGFCLLRFPAASHCGTLAIRPWGWCCFCIPAGLAVLYAFHRFFKRPLVLLLPRPVRAKLWPLLRAVSALAAATPGLDLPRSSSWGR